MAAMAGPGSEGSQELGGSSALPLWVQESKHLDHLLLLSQGPMWRAGLEGEQPGLKSESIRKARIAGSSFTFYASALAQRVNFKLKFFSIWSK